MMLATALYAAPAVAQAGLPLPPTRDELAGQQAPGLPQEGERRVVIDTEIERGPCPLADPASRDLRITLGSVSFTGLPGIDAGELDDTWQAYAGQEVPVAALCEIRDRAATLLRQQGYLAAVQIPPQRIESGGMVTMEVLAARLVEVQLRGDPGHASEAIEAHVAKLIDQPWFNVREAERNLLLLQGLPGFDVRLVLRSAGREPGEVMGDIVVTRRPISIVAGFQNYGSKTTGREGLFAELALNDLFGGGDSTRLGVYRTFDSDEQFVLNAGYELSLNSDGLRLGSSLVFGTSRPDVANGLFRSQTLAGELFLSYPVLLTQSSVASATIGFSAVNQKVDFSGIRLSRDNLRVLFARLDSETVDIGSLRGVGGYTQGDPKWRAALSLEARQGIDGLGASDDCRPLSDCLSPNVPISNLLADPSAFVIRADASLEYRPHPKIAIVATPAVQFSDSALLSYEQFSLGNYTIGRGFDPGIVQGDKVIGSGFELRYGRLAPASNEDLSVQPFVFLDTAWAWSNHGGFPGDPQEVFSAGGGLRLRLGDRGDLGMTVAVPLKRAGLQAERGDVRFLLTLTSRLVPWSTRR